MGRRKINYNFAAETPQQPESAGCKVFGHDKVLTDPVMIEYYHNYLKRFLTKNMLVGNVDDNGEYKIPEAFKRELVNMDKEIAEVQEGYFYILEANILEKTLNFTLQIEQLDGDMASATLYLKECIEGHENLDSVRSFVASVMLPFDEEFDGKLRRIFHMVDSKNDIKNGGAAIEGYLKKLLEELAFSEDIDDIGSQIYIIRMLKNLENAGAVGAEVLEEYKKVAAKTNVEKKGAYTELRQQMDKIIFKKGGFEKLETPNEEVVKPLQEYNDAVKKVEQVKAKLAKKAKRQQKQFDKDGVPPTIAGGAAKKAGGKSGGGGGKKGGGNKKGGAKKSSGGDDKKSAKKESGGPSGEYKAPAGFADTIKAIDAALASLGKGDEQNDEPKTTGKVAGKKQPDAPTKKEPTKVKEKELDADELEALNDLEEMGVETSAAKEAEDVAIEVDDLIGKKTEEKIEDLTQEQEIARVKAEDAQILGAAKAVDEISLLGKEEENGNY